MVTDPHPAKPRVFLSYAREDAAAARAIARSLEAHDLSVWLDQWRAVPEEDLTAQVLHAIESRDIFVVLLSPTALASSFVQEELAAALDRRDVDVVPVLLSAVELPPDLAKRQPVEFDPDSGDVHMLAERIRKGAAVDLGALTPWRFEALVGELLQRYGFSVVEADRPKDREYDLLATYHDPLGLVEPVEFIVEVKSYRHGRVSVKEIDRLSGLVGQRGGSTIGLLVTNAQLTSVARETLRQANATGFRLRAIDGPRLRQLLLENPDISRRYGKEHDLETT